MRCKAIAKVGQDQRAAQCHREHGHDALENATAHSAEGFEWWADPVDERGVTRAPWLKMFVDETARVLGDMNEPDRAEALKLLNEAFLAPRPVSAEPMSGDVYGPAPRYNRAFLDELEKHRANMDAARHAGYESKIADAVWFLLAVAHQP